MVPVRRSSLYVTSPLVESASFGDIFSAQSLLSTYIPEYDFRERHTVDIYAPGDRVRRVARDVDMASSPAVRLLFLLSGIPTHHVTFESLSRIGFIHLGERAGGEQVLGAIGKFWLPGSSLRRVSAEEFKDFAEPGYAKAAINLRTIGGLRHVTRLSSETRVQCVGSWARRWFSLSWTAAKPLSGIVLRQMLWEIKRCSEAG